MSSGSTDFFSAFNYSLANEDTRIEVDLLRPYANIFTICGSGARVLPLLHPQLKKLEIVDTSRAQLAFLQMKLQLIKALSAQDFRKILGYEPASSIERLRLINGVELGPEPRLLLQSLKGHWEEHGFLYLGRWENYLLKLSRCIRFFLGVDWQLLFAAKNLTEQRLIWQEIWPRKRMRILLHLLANPKVFNLFLYKGKMQAQMDLPEFLLERLELQMQNQLVAESFFLQFLFLGELAQPVGWPLEAQDQVIDQVKSCTADIQLSNDQMLRSLPLSHAQGFSLSDVVSYLSEAELQSLFAWGEALFRSRDCSLVLRSFARHPEFPKSWQTYRKTTLESDAQAKDCTTVYQFHIFSR